MCRGDRLRRAIKPGANTTNSIGKETNVEASTNQTTRSNTTYLPVAFSGEEEKMAKQSYNRVMVADKDEIKHFLKAIHKTLKSKA